MIKKLNNFVNDKPLPPQNTRCEVRLANGQLHVAHFGYNHFFDLDTGCHLNNKEVHAWREIDHEKETKH